MLRTIISLYSPNKHCLGDKLELELTDKTIKSILETLHRYNGEARVLLQITNEMGRTTPLNMAWRPEIGAFECSSLGRTGGYIFSDELAGAIGKSVSTSAKPCLVCLSSAQDLWRRGLIDRSTGEVQVYTEHRQLAMYGSAAFIYGAEPGQWDEVELECQGSDQRTLVVKNDHRQVLDHADFFYEEESGLNRIELLDTTIDKITSALNAFTNKTGPQN